MAWGLVGVDGPNILKIHSMFYFEHKKLSMVTKRTEQSRFPTFINSRELATLKCGPNY